jgi:hypothetical protein
VSDHFFLMVLSPIFVPFSDGGAMGVQDVFKGHQNSHASVVLALSICTSTTYNMGCEFVPVCKLLLVCDGN